MKQSSKILLLGAGLLALYWLPTLWAVAKMKVSFIGARLKSLKNETLSVELYMQCDNNSSVPVTIQAGKIDMYFNQYYFGTGEIGMYNYIAAHRSSVVSVVIDVPFTSALKAAWNSLLDGRLVENETLTLTGVVMINNKRVKVPAITFNAEEIENAING